MKPGLPVAVLVPFVATAVCWGGSPRPRIVRHPLPIDFSRMRPKTLEALPAYDKESRDPWQMDLRARDLSRLDLSGRTEDLLRTTFDSKTVFPRILPKGFDPSHIMELGKDPGLGVRALHRAGVTGKGVGVAIIDQGLLVEHPEYARRLRVYDEVHWLSPEASMHGCALASFLTGRSAGVAPGADLYFIANWFMDRSEQGKNVLNFEHLAKAIDRVLEINAGLPRGSKIRVLAIARGFQPEDKGYGALMEAVGRAKAQGIFVVSSSLQQHYGFGFQGLGREPKDDPGKAESYGPGSFWSADFWKRDPEESRRGVLRDVLLVPMDSRTAASPTGPDDYAFYREGGLSWAIPYVAGLYALACQADPAVTPERFWKLALETSDSVETRSGGKTARLDHVVNPGKLIQELRKR